MKNFILTTCIILFSLYPLSAKRKAPGFALLNNNNVMVYKSHLKGNLIITFWASWCLPCKKELPELVNLEKKYAKTKNIKLILITIDDKKNGNPILKANISLRTIGITHDFLLDMYKITLSKYLNCNNSCSVPATFLVNKAGYIIFKSTGLDTVTKLEKMIKQLN